MYTDFLARQCALGFAKMGYAVLPLHGVSEKNGARFCTCGDRLCTSPAKHPFSRLTPHGLKDATTDPAKIRAWPHAWFNYGVVTEPFIVIDIDKRNGGIENWDALWRKPKRHLPHTWEALTGGDGKHVFFANTAEVKCCNLAKGVDVKAIGGYVVGVGSIHISGITYRWAPQCAPNEVKLADPPQWLLDEIAERHPPTNGNGRYPSEHWEAIITAPLVQGTRNAQFIQVIGHLLAVGVDPFLAHELVQCWNMQRGNPPEDNETISAIFNRVMAYEECKCH